MSYLIVLEEFFVEKQPAAGEEYHLKYISIKLFYLTCPN